MNPFTLITGASQGFGKAMALECAERQMNLLLVALPQSGLKELAHFIKANFKVEVFYLELDLSDKQSCYSINDFISHRGIGIQYLINNAGVLSRGVFNELNEEYLLRQIDVNITTPTLLTRLLLNNMKQNTHAGILNVSSMAGFFALPKKQVYGATKAYITSFSKSLNKELKSDNITVTAICPGGLNTTTRLCYQNRIMGWVTRKTVLNPEEAAKIAIDSMFARKTLVVPGFVNKCLMILDKILPEVIKDVLANKELKKLPRAI